MRKLIAFVLVGLSLVTALPAWAQSAQQQPSLPPVAAPELLFRAFEAQEQQDYDRAILDYSTFILLNPTFGDAYFNRALVYQIRGDFDSALADANHVLTLVEDQPQFAAEVYTLRAEIHIERQDLGAALTDLDTAIEMSPEMPLAYVHRAGLHAFENRPQQALSDYSEAIRLVPEYVPAYLARGLVHEQLGNLDEALDDYNRAIDLNPAIPEAYIQRAQAHAQQADFDAALADMGQAINQLPGESSLYLMRGYINDLAQRSEDAASDYFQWMQNEETRTIPETMLSSGQSIVFEMNTGWLHQIPFEAERGQAVNVRADSADLDPLLVILDTDGSPLVADDDGGGALNSAIIGFPLPEDGRYTLVVGHAGGGAQGTVRVTFGLTNAAN